MKLYWIPAALLLVAASPSAANEFALILASQPNETKAIEYSQGLVAKGTAKNINEFNFLRSSNGWLAITLGIFGKAQCDEKLAELKARPGAPKDSYCSPTQRFTEKLTFNGGKLQSSTLEVGASAPTPTMPQPNPKTENSQQKAEIKSWSTLAPEMTKCMDISLRRNKSSVASLAQLGISPDDPRVNSVLKFCESVTSMVARKNFDCELSTSSGMKISTKCDEEFIYVTPNGAKIPLTFEDVVQRRLENQNISLLQSERPDALERRRAVEQKKQEEERKLAEQKAAEARQKEAEIQAKRQESEAARQAEIKRLAAEAPAKAAPFQIGRLYENNGSQYCDETPKVSCASEAEYKLLCERAKQTTKRNIFFTVANLGDDFKAAFTNGASGLTLSVSPQYVHCGITITGEGLFNGAQIQKSITGRVGMFIIADNGDVLVDSIATSTNSNYKDETSSLKWGEQDKARKAYAEEMAKKAALAEAAKKAERQARRKQEGPMWEARCIRYEGARQECATAGNINACMRIKLSGEDNIMGQNYCFNGKPMFKAMGLED